MIIAGIDPGKSGALAITYPDGAVQVWDVPTIKLRGKEVPAWQEWQRSWASALDFAGIDLVVIEDVSARPGQGVTSMFTFGRTLGFVHALAVASGASVQTVTPAVWKGKLGLLNSSKGASREKAVSIYPRSVGLLGRVKDDGRAEAILLAHYGRKFL
jgi:crossover junction endodeoxyribonuclease RuvC